MKKKVLLIICLIICIVIIGYIIFKFINKQENIQENNGGVGNMNIKETSEVIVSSNISNFSKEQIEVLNSFLEFQQGMIDKNVDSMNNLITENKTFTHMSGKVQTKEEYFNEIKNGTLNYYKSEVKDVDIKVNGNKATMTGKTSLTAKVYGASGTWTLNTNGYYIKENGKWISCNKDEI